MSLFFPHVCLLSLTVSLVLYCCCISLTVSHCCWLYLTDSPISIEPLHVSYCLPWLVAVSHCLSLLIAVAHCLSKS